MEFYQQALAIRREIADRAGVGRLLNNMALTYRKLGKDTQALIYFQQAMIMLEAIDDKTSVGRLLNNMGAIYESLGQSTKALKLLAMAVTKLEKIQRWRGLSDCLRVRCRNNGC